jgi:hypothetical protein
MLLENFAGAIRQVQSSVYSEYIHHFATGIDLQNERSDGLSSLLGVSRPYPSANIKSDIRRSVSKQCSGVKPVRKSSGADVLDQSAVVEEVATTLLGATLVFCRELSP